jgi:hypothetical protein
MMPPEAPSPSMGPSARSIASGMIRGPHDAAITLPPDVVEAAPVTVPLTTVGR